MGGGLRLGELECVEYYWKAPMPGGTPCAMAWYRLMLLFYQLLLCSSLSSNIEQKKKTPTSVKRTNHDAFWPRTRSTEHHPRLKLARIVGRR